ncbi:MAG: hypothetical protein RPU42_14490 [Candidatus Sedimenticola sp. (ex Thyasira tokunagai)]
MSQPTKEQWAGIAKQLNCQCDTVFLRCDGYLVHACLDRVKMSLKIVVYVNGWLKGEWCKTVTDPTALPEESRRFWFHTKRHLWTTKQLKSWEKIIGKRECRKRGYYTPRIFPLPHWNSANSFIRHIKKHNESIEILNHETYMAAIDALSSDEEKT